jgi:hypothetical protein
MAAMDCWKVTPHYEAFLRKDGSMHPGSSLPRGNYSSLQKESSHENQIV